MGDEVIIRLADGADEGYLRVMQYETIFVPPGGDPAPPEIVDEPAIRRYFDGFGSRAGDIGLVAINGHAERIGAVWARRFRADEPGYGFVDDHTPELAIAVNAGSRRRGIGGSLLRAFFELAPRCSLSVDHRNPAMRLYERLGFERVRVDGTAVVMVRDRPR